MSKRVRVLDSTKEQYRLLSLPVLLPPFCFSRCHLSHNTLDTDHDEALHNSFAQRTRRISATGPATTATRRGRDGALQTTPDAVRIRREEDAPARHRRLDDVDVRRIIPGWRRRRRRRRSSSARRYRGYPPAPSEDSARGRGPDGPLVRPRDEPRLVGNDPSRVGTISHRLRLLLLRFHRRHDGIECRHQAGPRSQPGPRE